MIKDIIINSFKRTGNTFLSDALELSYFANNVDWEHYRITSHMHNMFVQRIPQSEDFYQLTMIRNPEDTILSAALFDGHYMASDFNSEEGVDFLCKQTSFLYNRFYDEWLKNKNARMIKFEDLTGDINSVLKLIYQDLGLSYENGVTDEGVKTKVRNSDSNRNETIFTAHLPRDIDNLKEYERLRESLLDLDVYKQSLEIYNNVLEAL